MGQVRKIRSIAVMLAPALVAAQLLIAEPAAAAPCETIDLRIGTDSELDLGWSGGGHNQGLANGATISLAVVKKCSVANTVCQVDADCPGGETCDPTCDCDNPGSDPECEIFGPVDSKRCLTSMDQQCQVASDCPSNTPCVAFFGPPLPLSAFGTPTCWNSYFQNDLTGTLDLQTGRVEASTLLRSRVHLGIEVGKPCPVCGDPAQNPQVGDSFSCDGGPRDGETCTVDGVSERFGGSSYECPPNPGSNISGSGLAMPLNRLTTEADALQATLPCGGLLAPLHPSGGSAVCLDTFATCSTNDDCLRCTGAPTIACTSNGDCTGNGTCAAAPAQPIACGIYCHCGFCDGDPDAPCSSDAECDLGETCEQGTNPYQQVQNNGCDDLTCGRSNLEECCSAGEPDCVDATPQIGECTLLPFACANNTDCTDQSAGDCVLTNRPCFEGVISRTGTASPLDSYCVSEPLTPSCTSNVDCSVGACVPYTMLPTLEGFFCVPPTSSAGTRAVLGIPGPAVLTLDARFSLDGALPACICGNGALDCVEHCDDGNEVEGDGCDSNCSVTACGNGVVSPSTGEDCDDGDVSNGDGCDTNCTITACGNGVLSISTGEECDDGNVVSDDGCSATCLIETPTPTTCEAATGCIALGIDGRSKLKISNSSDPAKDKLAWKWTKGLETDPTDLGDPSASTAYTLCLYDSGNAVASYEVPASNTLWTSGSSGTLVYRDKPGTAAGITSIKLRPGADGKARVDAKAAGTSLLLPAPVSLTALFAQSPSVTVRLVNSDGTCWEADFPVAGTKKNTAERFQAGVP